MPREVLREMGELGFLSLRVPEALGGSGLDARASVVLAEEVGRSTHGGFAITVLVHTDMASPHLLRFGNQRQLEKYLPGIMAGSTITRRRRHRAGRRLRRGRHPHPGGARRRQLGAERRQDVHHQRRPWRSLFHCRPHRPRSQGQSRHHHVHRREGHARLQGRPRPRQDRLALFRYRRIDLRGVPGAGRERAGRGQSRLLRHHGQLPDRAAGDRRHGDGRGARGAAAHLRACQPAHRLRQAAVGQAGDPPAPVAAAGRGRGGAPARASHRLARCRGPRFASPRSRW